MPDVVSARIRAVFRDLASGIVLRDIDRLWESEGFTHVDYQDNGGQRVSLWRAYEAGINWTDPDATRRVLRVFEGVTSEFAPTPEVRGRLLLALNREV